MSRRQINAGSTSVMVPILVQDTSSSFGSGLAGLAYDTNGLIGRYRREGQSNWNVFPLANSVPGTFMGSGFVTTSGVPGKYEIGLPDPSVAQGAKWVEFEYYGATNMLPILLEFELHAINYQDAQFAGLNGFSGVMLSNQGRNEVASGVWTANPSHYSGANTFGRELQPIYYADIKWDWDFSNNRDEYSVNWFRGPSVLTSGLVTSAFINVYRTSDGTKLVNNQPLNPIGFGLPTLRYNEITDVITAGEPYSIEVSGIIDGGSKTWQKIVSRHKLS